MTQILPNQVRDTVIVTPEGIQVPLQDIIDSLVNLADGFQFRNYDIVSQLGCSRDEATKIATTASSLIPLWDK